MSFLQLIYSSKLENSVENIELRQASIFIQYANINSHVPWKPIGFLPPVPVTTLETREKMWYCDNSPILQCGSNGLWDNKAKWALLSYYPYTGGIESDTR